MKTAEFVTRVQTFIINKMLIPDMPSVDRWAIRIGVKTIVPHKVNSFIAQNKAMLEDLGIYSSKTDSLSVEKLKTLLDDTMIDEQDFRYEFGGVTYKFDQTDLDELFMGVS